MKPNYLLWFTHQKLHVIARVASTFAFLDGFFPLAAGEQFNAAITHLSGLPQLLYVLPLVTLIIAIMALYRRIHSTAWWYLVVGAIGVLIGMVAIAGCKQNVNWLEGESSVTLAGELLLLYYFTVASVGAFLKFGSSGVGVEQKQERFNAFNPQEPKHDEALPVLNPDFVVVEPAASGAKAAIAPAPSAAIVQPEKAPIFKPVAAVTKMTMEDALAFTDKIYYWIRWQPSIEGTRGSLGFNLCAFLFGTCWCFYRKLYVVGLILIAVESVVFLSLAVSLGIFLVLIGAVTADAPIGTSHTALAGVLVGVVAFLLVYVPFGLYANRLLFNRASKEIAKIDASGISGEARNAIIKTRGGVSIPGLIVGIILSMAVNFAMK